MKKVNQLLRSNTSGFTFVELLVVIVIMAVLIAATANFLFSQGGSKARDAKRKNTLTQVSALLEQFVSEYGEPPNGTPKSRKLTSTNFLDKCKTVNNYKQLMDCFEQAKYIDGEGVENLSFDPKEGIAHDGAGGSNHYYLYGGANNGWKLCTLLENQTDSQLNGKYDGSPIDSSTSEGSRTYCVVASNRTMATAPTVASGK